MNMTDAQMLVLLVAIMVATSLQANLREAHEAAEMMPDDRGNCESGYSAVPLLSLIHI